MPTQRICSDCMSELLRSMLGVEISIPTENGSIQGILLGFKMNGKQLTVLIEVKEEKPPTTVGGKFIVLNNVTQLDFPNNPHIRSIKKLGVEG